MTLLRACRVALWTLLASSLGFAFYLYPDPNAVADRLMATDSESAELRNAEIAPKPGMDVDTETKQAIRASFRRGWLVNFTLFALGTVASVLWLSRGYKRRAAAWLSILGIVCFIALFSLAVLPSRVSSIDEWTTLYQRLFAVKAWTFIGAELHRVLSFATSIIALVMLLILTARDSPRLRVD